MASRTSPRKTRKGAKNLNDNKTSPRKRRKVANKTVNTPAKKTSPRKRKVAKEKKPANKTVNKPANKTVNKPANKTVNKPANKPANKTAKKICEKEKNAETNSEKWTAAEWANFVGTVPITRRTLVPMQQVVFEYDFQKYASDTNPGVGPCLGYASKLPPHLIFFLGLF